MKRELKTHELMSRAYAPMLREGWRLAACPDDRRKRLGAFWKDELKIPEKALRNAYMVFLSDRERTIVGLFKPGDVQPLWWQWQKDGSWVPTYNLAPRMPEPEKVEGWDWGAPGMGIPVGTPDE